MKLEEKYRKFQELFESTIVISVLVTDKSIKILQVQDKKSLPFSFRHFQYYKTTEKLMFFHTNKYFLNSRSITNVV